MPLNGRRSLTPSNSAVSIWLNSLNSWRPKCPDTSAFAHLEGLPTGAFETSKEASVTGQIVYYQHRSSYALHFAGAVSILMGVHAHVGALSSQPCYWIGLNRWCLQL